MYVYQQIIFDINIYTQKRSKSWSLYKSVPTVWRRGNKRCREPLNRWRRVHLEPSFWGGLSCYFLKAKLLSCTLKSPWMLISFSTGLMGCDWSESSEVNHKRYKLTDLVQVLMDELLVIYEVFKPNYVTAVRCYRYFDILVQTGVRDTLKYSNISSTKNCANMV